MIAYLATAAHTYTMTSYLRTWGLAQSRRIRVLAYEKLPPVQAIGARTWIFSDLDRLSPDQREAATALWDRLSESDPPVRLLNNPRRVVLRYELLRRLYELGVNAFQAYRLAELPHSIRFPVFLREEGEHSGPLSALLGDRDALDTAVTTAIAAGRRSDNMLVIEFCDTSDESGLFRKYGAFSVGEGIVPRHLIVSRDWIVNVDRDEVSSQKLIEERAYLAGNPHESKLREFFGLANIDYGRIDYSLLEGKPQVWEINTNPTPVLLPWSCKVRRLPNHWRFAKGIGAAFKALDTAATQRRSPTAGP